MGDSPAAQPTAAAQSAEEDWHTLGVAPEKNGNLPAAERALVVGADTRLPGSAPQNGAAGSAPRHMTPCACHCAACRAAGHGNKCVVLRMGLLHLFHGEADPVDLVLQHYYHGASGWDTARFDEAIWSVQYGPAGDVIAVRVEDRRIHLICAQTGAKFLCLKGHR